MTEAKFRYFSPGDGRAVTRYGTDQLIGGTRTAGGYVVNTAAVVAIPVTEFNSFRREYLFGLKNGDLVEKTDADYAAWQVARKEAIKAAQAAREPKNINPVPPVEGE